MIWPAWVVAGLLLVLALIWVYRGGTTLNDHLVALIVAGCMAVYPVLWTGAVGVGIAGPWLVLLGGGLALGAVGIFGLFFVLEGCRERDPGPRMALAYLSQPAYSFALWAGLVGVFWLPGVGVLGWLGHTDAHPMWPGWLLVGPACLTIWGTFWTYARHGRVNRLALPTGRLEGHKLRLVHLSDLHASPVMGRADLMDMVRQVNALAPDLVCVTGDLLMPFSEAHHPYLLDALAGIEAPVFGCPGNHDLPVAETLAQELAEIGVGWMVDQATVVTIPTAQGPVQVELAGVDFEWKDGAGQVARALAKIGPAPEVGLRVLMAHDPRLFAFVPTERFDLVLSGHTHGGQVGWNMFGLPGSVLGWFGLYDQGLFTRGQSTLYVHRGNWHTGLPPRMGIAAEVVAFELG